MVTEILLKEYENLEFVFGKEYISMMFRDFNSYCEVREDSTFYEIREELVNLEY